MDDRESQTHRTVQEWLNKLKSGDPNRALTIVSLEGLAKFELHGLRTLGTAGTSPELPSIVGAFLQSLSQDADPKIRATVAKGAGKIAHDIVRDKISLFRDIPTLVEQGLVSALKDESPRVRKTAARVLRRIGTPSALSAAPPKRWWKFW